MRTKWDEEDYFQQQQFWQVRDSMSPAMFEHAVQRFAALFQGRTDVWGALHGQAVKEPVTLAHFSRHLRGRTSLGIYPLTSAGAVRWFAIDIDRHDPALARNLMNSLINLGINSGIYLERSKGKGFHIIVLLSDWTLASLVRRIAKAALREAGLPLTTEIFPKQDQLTQQTPWGNYLNLAYFGGDNGDGRRMVVDSQTLKPLPLVEWLSQVQLFPAEQLVIVANSLQQAAESADTLRRDKPKLADLLTTNPAIGTRRPTLVSLAGHLRVRGVAEEVALALLIPWAREHFEPALPDEEIERHVRGIYRRYSFGHGRWSARDLPALEVHL